MKPLTLEEIGIKTDDNEMCIKGIDELPIFSWNTKTKEFYVLGHKFDGINSIEDFINYIHNLDKENKSLQSQLKAKEDNWNYIKKMLKEARNEEFNIIGYCGTCTDVDIDFLLNKMQELEQGSDSNVKD